MKRILRMAFIAMFTILSIQSQAQNSVAHRWVEVNLTSVRSDFARPTVHARNLFHLSVGMYDAWAAYDDLADTYFLGKTMGTFVCPFNGIPTPADIEAAREEAISFAAYRILRHRYTNSPGQVTAFYAMDTLMTNLGFDVNYTNTDYSTGVPAALGNYIGQQLITAALVDGSNEGPGGFNGYANQYYEPVNDSLPIQVPEYIGNPTIDSLNRWQPLSFTLFCDQSNNNVVNFDVPFLSPEWGDVLPFALHDSVKTVKNRDGHDWTIYHDPTAPPRIGLEGDQQTDLYRWNMELVAKWSGHLDPDDPTVWDISPASIGNIPLESLPTDFNDYDQFYDFENGGDASVGHSVNPATGLPYAPQMVKRGDYARILAEFWADGPDSETPPGHWFGIYNEISQYPEFTWQWNGQGAPLDHLEYDIKTYFSLAGAMHDAAIAAWSVKGYYDYIRPVSSIRAMAELGQSTNSGLPNYHPAGLGLDPGFIELIDVGDPLAGENNEYVGELKMMCWLGPLDEDTCIAGAAPVYGTEIAHVGWKLALDWWPYQRPTFITPPFAGYVSGHSTFSRAAAEIMTLTTGDSYFPGGMGTFSCPQDQFLIFEQGPSEDITLQWATYQDASDQCSLSRIWGGIHPPVDDIPGRKMGYEIGHNTFELAERYFNGGTPQVESIVLSDDVITDADAGSTLTATIEYSQPMDTGVNLEITFAPNALDNSLSFVSGTWAEDSIYVATYTVLDANENLQGVSVSASNAQNAFGNLQAEYVEAGLYLDTENPTATATTDYGTTDVVLVDIVFSEVMDITSDPTLSFPVEDPLTGGILSHNPGMSSWIDNSTYQVHYDIGSDIQMYDIDFAVSLSNDSLGNEMTALNAGDLISVDNHAPSQIGIAASHLTISDTEVGAGTFSVDITFDEDMDQNQAPFIGFPVEDPMANTLTMDSLSNAWTSSDTYTVVFSVADANEELELIDMITANARDLSDNPQVGLSSSDVFNIDTKNPSYLSNVVSADIITDVLSGSSFTIQIEFDEAMDTGVQPNITFPIEDPSNTLSVGTGTWIDPMNYSLSFDVLDMEQVLDDIDVSISSAVDLAGNPMSTETLIDLFSIEMESPTVADFAANQSLISDANAGETLTMPITFSEEMNEAIDPVITFSVAGLTSTFIFNSGTWTSSTEYEVIYDIVDDNMMATEVGIDITGAYDLYGNQMIGSSQTNVFDLDMENPMVDFTTPSVTIIDNSLVGTGTFSIEVTFTEEMNELLVPAISFDNEDPGVSISSNAISAWTSSSSYNFVFDVQEGFSSLADIDITIANAADIIGNPLSEITIVDVFSLDIASGLAQQDFNDYFQVYPNPIQQGVDLTIRQVEEIHEASITLYDGIGRALLNQEMNGQAGQINTLATADLPTGTYLIVLNHTAGTATFTLVIME